MIKVDEDDPVGEMEASFPYRDVQIKRNVDVKEFYDLQTEIGRGKFGTVLRCREKSTGLSLAAKFVSVARKEDRRNVEKEVDIMRSLQHPRLLQMYDAFEFDKTVCLILELIEGGELFERVIDDDFVLTEKACTVFMRQICEGIDFVHQQHILHLDLKPENILCLTKTGNRIKIIDFGLARRYEPGKKLQVLFGTPEFVAPEVVNFDQIGFNTDMWSVGVICYVLLSGLSPFMGDTDIETMANVTIAKYDFDDEVFDDISADAKDFIGQLLVKEKEKRMCAEACLHHKWLRRPKPKPPASEPEPLLEVIVKEAPVILTDINNNVVEVGPLEGAKDNLKNIVERWTEHPDSPYIFDNTAHTISPCPSLASVLINDPEIIAGGVVTIDTAEQPDPGPPSPAPPQAQPTQPEEIKPYNILLQERLLTGSERRASDSSCLVRLKSHHVDINDRINLADEIRKLSDKLFKMASFPDISATECKKTNISPLVTADNQAVESMTVTETRNGTTTTRTTFKSVTASENGKVNTSHFKAETSISRGDGFRHCTTGSAISDSFTAKATTLQIPTKKFWPIEPGRIQLDDIPISPEEEAAAMAQNIARRNSRRLSAQSRDAPSFPSFSRSTSSASSSATTHSAPPSPRWSPDPELPPPPTSELTKDLILRLLNRLDSVDMDLGTPDWTSMPSSMLLRNQKEKRPLIAQTGAT